MDEKSNEELLDELIRRARLSVGKLTKGEACAGEYAAVLARMAGPGEVVVQDWQPIETAPKDGRTLLLGYHNSHGKWRTLRGQWFTQCQIDEEWEDDSGATEGWYETSVEADDPPNCWSTNPTHWMPFPARRKNGGNDDQGK